MSRLSKRQNIVSWIAQLVVAGLFLQTLIVAWLRRHEIPILGDWLPR